MVSGNVKARIFKTSVKKCRYDLSKDGYLPTLIIVP